MDFENSKTLSDWDKWKASLGKAVDLGQKVGMSENTIDNIAKKVGDFLSANVDPENREQRAMQELWRSGSDEDRRSLAKMMVNMAQKENNH